MENHPLLQAFNKMKEKNRMFSFIAISKLSAKNKSPDGAKFIIDHFSALKTTGICEIITMDNMDTFVFYDFKNEDYIKMMVFRINYYLSGERIVELNALFTNYSKENIDDAEALINEYLKKDNLSENTTPLKEETKQEEIKQEETRELKTLFNPVNIKNDPLTAKTLSKVEDTLGISDISSMIRRQQVCSIIGESYPLTIFEEVYVSIDDIKKSIIPNTDIERKNWLFRHLTETLDKRLLTCISRHDDGSYHKDFSINMNVSSILSKEFTRFDDNINPLARSTIVLELDAIDVFKDLDFYISARNYVKERGYKICIDGVNDKILPIVSRQKLEADLIKIPWHEKYNEKSFDINALNENNPEKVILCRIDNDDALKIGQNLGIILFQGKLIEKIKTNHNQKSISIPSRI